MLLLFVLNFFFLFLQRSLKGLIVFFIVISFSSLILAQEIKIYDKDYNLKYRVEGDRIYDRDWNLRYRIEGDKIYDKYWNLKYHMEGNKVYDKDWNLKYRKEGNKIYDKNYNLKYILNDKNVK